MPNVTQYIPLIGRAATTGPYKSSENFNLLRKRLVVTVVAAAALCLIAAWIKASLLPLFVPLILGGAIMVAYLDYKKATKMADEAASFGVSLFLTLKESSDFNPPDGFKTVIKRVHSRLEAARMFVERVDVHMKGQESNKPLLNKAYSEEVLSCKATPEIFELLLHRGFILTAKCLQEALDKAEEEPRYLEIIYSALRENKLGSVGLLGYLHFSADEAVSFWMKSSSPKALAFLDKAGLPHGLCRDTEGYSPLTKLLQESVQPNCQIEKIKHRIMVFLGHGGTIFQTINSKTNEDLLEKCEQSIRENLRGQKSAILKEISASLDTIRKTLGKENFSGEKTVLKELTKCIQDLKKNPYVPRFFIVDSEKYLGRRKEPNDPTQDLNEDQYEQQTFKGIEDLYKIHLLNDDKIINPNLIHY